MIIKSVEKMGTYPFPGVALWISSATFAAIRDARGGSVLSGCSRRRVVMCCPSIAVWRQ
jgi:hypothetical protein